MKIDPILLKFPKSLPNDEQQFMTYYPYKFPRVIDFFEAKALALHDNPEEYMEFVHSEFDELDRAVSSVIDKYQAGDQTDLNFLVKTDQQFNKIFCFKFWVINYVFADGPIHEFYVDQLKSFARKMVDATDDVESYEQQIIRLQRDLLQTDYADIYLVQALHGNTVMKFLENDPFSKSILDTVAPLIDEHGESDADKINEIWKPIVERMTNPDDHHYDELSVIDPNLPKSAPLIELPPLVLPLNQVKMRKTDFPLYSFLNHTVEFRDENQQLEERYEDMKQTIAQIFDIAKSKLSEEEYRGFELSYEMSKCFSMSKDIMGNIDHRLLPVWERDVHEKVHSILSENSAVRYPSVNHASMFSSFVWYLPEDLKAEVMSVDESDFNIKDYENE
ncbi:MAG: hypothetical protein LBL08_01035 [Candidatus Nomurabacteria bacterium]|jgi:hypothetical protein|nr:hypothetical protein [Candidatus Nomurabacteria bacterium]